MQFQESVDLVFKYTKNLKIKLILVKKGGFS